MNSNKTSSRDTVIRNLGQGRHRTATREATPSRGYKKHRTSRSHRSRTHQQLPPSPATGTFKLSHLASLLLFVMITSAVIALWISSKPTSPSEPSPPPTALLPHIAPVIESIPGKAPATVVERFSQSSDPDQRLQWVRNATETSRHFHDYPEQALNQVPQQITPGPYVSVNGMSMETFIARFPEGNKRTISIIATDEGWKIDWDSYARYCSTSWHNLQHGKTQRALIRAILHPSHIYPAPFKNEQEWQCYAISSPDMNDNGRYLYAYAQKDSPTGKLLAHSFGTSNNTRQPFTFTIQSVNNSHSKGHFQITRVHALGWVLGETDAESLHLDNLEIGTRHE